MNHPMTTDAARTFADAWFAAWNAHKLDAILACYDAAIQHSSPFIKKYNDAVGKGGEPWITGLADLRAYFGRALERNPTLAFKPVHVATGLESVILVYRRHSHDTPAEGELSAEVFFLNAGGKIVRSVSHYG